MSKSTKQTTENKPPEWAKPLLTTGASEALDLYRRGVGGNTFMGSTVAPLSGTTMDGVNQMRNAGANWNTGATRGLYGNLAGTALNDPYVNKTSDLAGNIADMASGKHLKEGNPYADAVLGKSLDDTAARVRSSMSGSGRYGSNFSQQTLGNTLADQSNQFRYQQYNDDQQRMLDANALSGQLYGQASNLRGAGLDRAYKSADSMAGLDQRNFENRLKGAEATLGAGSILDKQGQALRADQVARWYAKDNEDWQRVAMLLGAGGQSALNYGTQVSQSRQPIDFGGILGGMKGLFGGKSDIRAKEDIIRIGQANGINLYAFRYKGQPQRYVGAIAQDIPLGRSDAVFADADGLLAVDYAKLGFLMTRIQ